MEETPSERAMRYRSEHASHELYATHENIARIVVRDYFEFHDEKFGIST
jgi:hypothetical protein